MNDSVVIVPKYNTKWLTKQRRKKKMIECKQCGKKRIQIKHRPNGSMIRREGSQIKNRAQNATTNRQFAETICLG